MNYVHSYRHRLILSEGYTKTMKTIAEKQAALAGYRLADEIRDCVSP
jgi:hypothetical protein